jgi:hypothetical protein
MYTFEILTSVPQIDTIMQATAIEKTALVNRKNNLEFLIQSKGILSTKLPQEIASITQLIEGTEAAIATLPEGRLKQNQQKLLNSYENKLISLTQKSETYGSEAIIDRQYELAIVELEITANDTYMAGLTARKAELQAANG